MAERFEIVEKALLKLLEEKKYATLRDILTTMNPMDVAGLFDGLDEKQIPLMFRLLPKNRRRRRLWKWSRRPRSFSSAASPTTS